MRKDSQEQGYHCPRLRINGYPVRKEILEYGMDKWLSKGIQKAQDTLRINGYPIRR